jgi:hypothetical protein
LLLRLLAGGRCMQFGNDDVSSKVWVAASASLVGLSGIFDGFSCALSCRFGVGAAVECPCGNDDRQSVACGGLGQCKPCIFILRSSSSKSELSLVGVCGRLLACGQVGRGWCLIWSCSIMILVHLYRFSAGSPLMNRSNYILLNQ